MDSRQSRQLAILDFDNVCTDLPYDDLTKTPLFKFMIQEIKAGDPRKSAMIKELANVFNNKQSSIPDDMIKNVAAMKAGEDVLKFIKQTLDEDVNGVIIISKNHNEYIKAILQASGLEDKYLKKIIIKDKQDVENRLSDCIEEALEQFKNSVSSSKDSELPIEAAVFYDDARVKNVIFETFEKFSKMNYSESLASQNAILEMPTKNNTPTKVKESKVSQPKNHKVHKKSQKVKDIKQAPKQQIQASYQPQQITQVYDLKVYPKEIVNTKGMKQLTLPDLHGNSMGMLHRLIAHGVIELKGNYEEQQEQLDELNDIYLARKEIQLDGVIYAVSNITKEDRETFSKILANATYHPEKFECVRFIGDMLGDRGLNDILSLLVLEALNINKIRYEIILSNHDLNFIAWYLLGYEKMSELVGYVKGQSRSFENLMQLVQYGDLKEEQINSLAKKYYFPYLLPFNYSINSSIKPPELTFFSHTNAGTEVIEGFAKLYKIPLLVGTVIELGKTIDNIKDKFINQTPVEFANQLKKEQYIMESRHEEDFDPILTPYLYTTWNRKITKVRAPQSTLYTLKNVHGHQGGTIPRNWENNGVTGVNLDYGNDLGYSNMVDEFAIGIPPQLGWDGPLNCYLSPDSAVLIDTSKKQQSLGFFGSEKKLGVSTAKDNFVILAIDSEFKKLNPNDQDYILERVTHGLQLEKHHVYHLDGNIVLNASKYKPDDLTAVMSGIAEVYKKYIDRYTKKSNKIIGDLKHIATVLQTDVFSTMSNTIDKNSKLYKKIFTSEHATLDDKQIAELYESINRSPELSLKLLPELDKYMLLDTLIAILNDSESTSQHKIQQSKQILKDFQSIVAQQKTGDHEATSESLFSFTKIDYFNKEYPQSLLKSSAQLAEPALQQVKQLLQKAHSPKLSS